MNSTSFFSCVEEAAKLYSFLLNVLINIYVFPLFDICDEEPSFLLTFSKNSSIRKYVCETNPSVKFDGLLVRVSLEKDIVTYKTFITTTIAPNYNISNRCESLGYKDGFKVFTSQKDVLDECLRLENAFLECIPQDLDKLNGECLICNTETTLVKLPCHKTHIVCEQCAAKIVERNCTCPFCRSVFTTTVVLKDKDEYEDEYEYEYEHEDCWQDCQQIYVEKEEEKYFRKVAKK